MTEFNTGLEASPASQEQVLHNLRAIFPSLDYGYGGRMSAFIYTRVLDPWFSEQRKQVVCLVGFPGAGKSYYDEVIKEEMKDMESKLRRSQFQTSPEIRYADVKWEQGEEQARAKGRVSTPRDKPFEEAELLAGEDELEREVLQRLEDSDVIMLEVPADEAIIYRKQKSTLHMPELFDIPKAGQWLGRPMGSRLLYNLRHSSKRSFKRLPYDVSFVGIEPGSFLWVMAREWRRDLKAAPLDQVARVFEEYGKSPPRDLEEARLFQDEGASVEQIDFLRRRKAELIAIECHNHLMHYPKGLEIAPLKGTDPRALVKLMADNDLYREAFGLTQLYTVARRVLGLSQERILIGSNNPDPLSMKLSPELIARKGWERFCRPLTSS